MLGGYIPGTIFLKLEPVMFSHMHTTHIRHYNEMHPVNSGRSLFWMARIHFETDCVTEIKISLNSITYELDVPIIFTDTSSHHEKTVTEI